MRLLDRDLQRRLLTAISVEYPDAVELPRLAMTLEVDKPQLVFNALYLQDHGLARCTVTRTLQGTHVRDIAITHLGLDFIAADGGLSAVLNVTTVRLEESTLRALIDARITQSDLPEHEKQTMRDLLRAARTEALEETTRRLVGLALDQWPSALQLLRTLLA